MSAVRVKSRRRARVEGRTQRQRDRERRNETGRHQLQTQHRRTVYSIGGDPAEPHTRLGAAARDRDRERERETGKYRMRMEKRMDGCKGKVGKEKGIQVHHEPHTGTQEGKRASNHRQEERRIRFTEGERGAEGVAKGTSTAKSLSLRVGGEERQGRLARDKRLRFGRVGESEGVQAPGQCRAT